MNPVIKSLLKYALTHALGTDKGTHAYNLLVNVVVPAVEALDPAALAELDKIADNPVVGTVATIVGG